MRWECERVRESALESVCGWLRERARESVPGGWYGSVVATPLSQEWDWFFVVHNEIIFSLRTRAERARVVAVAACRRRKLKKNLPHFLVLFSERSSEAAQLLGTRKGKNIRRHLNVSVKKEDNVRSRSISVGSDDGRWSYVVGFAKIWRKNSRPWLMVKQNPSLIIREKIYVLKGITTSCASDT